MTQSYFDNIDLYLMSALMSAQNSIRAAVAWCTDAQILRVLATSLQRGVEVELIVNDDKTNRKADYSMITSNGGKVFFADKDSNIMHNKFCIIDHCRVVCGSYNWTSHAKSNDEQLTIIDDDADEINSYEQKFGDLLMAIENRARLTAEKVQYSRSKLNKTKVSFEVPDMQIEQRRNATFSISYKMHEQLDAAAAKYKTSRSAILERVFFAWWDQVKEQ